MNYETAAFLGGVVATLIGLSIWKNFFSGYFNRKGNNRADREDMTYLTELVESVKSQFAVLLEDHKSKNQLRLAALDKRLQAHQEAYAQWRKMVRFIHTPEIHNVVAECQEWWNQNCLYLEPEARDSLTLAYWCATNHTELLNSIRYGGADKADIKLNWKNIMDAGDIIVRSVALPGLTTFETKEAQLDSESTNRSTNPTSAS